MFDPTPLLTAVAATPELTLAVLFGSAARGTLRPDSDVDMAVLLQDDTPEVRERVEAALSLVCDRPLDFVVIHDAPPQLRFEIAKGTLLFERRAGAWRAMKTNAMIDWWEWQETARAIHGVYARRVQAQVRANHGP